MLKLVWLSQQACQKTLWKEFDPSRQTWVVSDRKTEFFLNQNLLQSRQIISEPVIRSKDFWNSILVQNHDDIRLLDRLGSRIQARDFLLNEGTADWCKRPHAPERLLDACTNLAALVTHDRSEEVLSAFEQQFERGSGPFLEVARLGLSFYRHCLATKRLPRFFLPFYLHGRDRLVDGRNIIFDLGFEMRDGERELIQRLAQTNDITILIPCPGPEKLDEAGLYAYRNIDVGVAKVQTVKLPPCQAEPPQTEVWRCSSPEAEARKAVELVAHWVSEGIAPEKICICAPQISDYEHTLSHDLEWEGIGLQRTLKTRLSASRLFRALNARLQILNGALGASLVEEAFLSTALYRQSSRRRTERRVLRPVLREAQIPEESLRDQVLALRQRIQSGVVQGRLTLNEFENVLIDLFGSLAEEASRYEEPLEADQRNNLFLKALSSLRRELGPAEISLSLWIEAWQEVTNDIRMNYKQAAEHGVWAVDLSSAEETPAEHLIILGALEGSTPSSVAAGLGDERLGFLRELGFDLTAPAKRKADPQMLWLMTGARRNIIVSCPKTDSTGKSVAASPLWLKLAASLGKNLDQLDFARHTKWVDVQKTILEPRTAAQVDRFKRWPSALGLVSGAHRGSETESAGVSGAGEQKGTAELIGDLVVRELTGQRVVQIGLMGGQPLAMLGKPVKLSATRIEAYWQCPFKFFARSMLGLFDEEDLEVEPSPQARGQWMHAAVEQIMGSGRKLEEWNDQELNDLIDNLEQVQKQKHVSSDVWPSIRKRFVRQLKQFIRFESDWRKKYPRATPVSFEAKIDGLLGWPQNKPEIHFSIEKPKTDDDFWAEFHGSIDRLDYTATGRAIIIDYKASTSGLSNIPSWPKKGSFQLALYTEAVEAGLVDDEPRKVIAAQYYGLRNPEREKGFKLIDEDLHGILPEDGAPKANVDTETRNKLFDELNQETHGILERIRQGDMSPNPHNQELCPACSWRTSCRAPHLS